MIIKALVQIDFPEIKGEELKPIVALGVLTMLEAQANITVDRLNKNPDAMSQCRLVAVTLEEMPCPTGQPKT